MDIYGKKKKSTDSKILFSMKKKGGLRCIIKMFLHVSREANAIGILLLSPHLPPQSLVL